MESPLNTRGTGDAGADSSSAAAEAAAFAPLGECSELSSNEHVVEFFDQEETLLRSVLEYVSAGLAAADACIVIATPARREDLCARLRDAGHDVPALNHRGQLLFLDAAATLDGLLVGGFVDPELFRHRIGHLIERAAYGQRGVRVFGEMVALLWKRGCRDAAVALEQQWNELQIERPFRLLCAYDIKDLGGSDAVAPLREVCESHHRIVLHGGGIVPHDSGAGLPDGDAAAARVQDAVAWQHKARLLEQEVAGRRDTENSLYRLKQELEQQVRDLRCLNDLSVRLGGIREVELVLEEVLQGALAMHDTEMGLLSLCDETRDGLSLEVHRGFDPDIAGKLEWITSGTGACGACLERQQRVVIEDTELDPVFDRLQGLARSAGFRSCHSTPLVTRAGRMIGVLSVQFRRPGRPSDREMRLMDQLAQMAADSIENANLHRQAQRELEERRQLLMREQQARSESERARSESDTARSESEKANLLKDEFLATVSHELRTPLTAILGWAHMLRHETLDDEMESYAIETIERAATSQAQLVEDILDVSRMISGKLRLKVQPVDPEAVVEAAVDSVRLAATSKGIRLSVVSKEEPSNAKVLGDAGRLQQVVWNLLSNAVKFTPAGGRVEVRLRRGPSHLQIRVSDTGEGIAREFMPYLFDRFRQADGSSARRHGGLGLGLALVRHLVELHGGTVRADSPGVGAGSTFTVRLPMSPIAVRKPRTRTRTAAVERSAMLAGVQVLLVDPNPETLWTLAAMLAKEQAEVRPAGSAVEAFEILQTFHPSVIVSGLSMRGEDGYGFIRRLRAEEGDGSIPAIALTAHVRVEDRRRALEAGYSMFVPTPVEPAELVTTISSLAGIAVESPA